MSHFSLRIDDETREFDVTRQGDRLHVSSTDFAADVRLLHRDGDRLLLEIQQRDGAWRRVRVIGTRQGDARQLWIDGRTMTAQRERRATTGRGADSGSLAASIPAVVSQVLVAVGDAVSAGDKLILLESMKMIIPIQAPHGGRVTKILCSPGDSVPAGLALLEIEAE